ncbi:MAG: glycosyltransferase [Bacteroidia bacterium]|nr:glycosyltransferase [Bacteroidia bacterium]MBT8309298.1 glycosyltransferase [Bacteroidia bacterium]NND11033.1 glycosyltransferase [Flavobacteriaceae bacterium]NNL60575.1 glycosyltransferase [Flavobacteriaceae bacterium]
MILALIIITVTYLVIIGRFIYGFDKVKGFQLLDSHPETTFTIIIPFRNESENLQDLLKSLSGLSYPSDKYEVILVNDDSEDNSLDIILKFLDSSKINMKVISNDRKTNSPKKDAISTAINKAKNEWILTSDADCIFHNEWLLTFDAFIQEKKPEMVVGPVTYDIDHSLFERFQFMDFMSLAGATIGAFGINKPFLCNGANLAYKKEAFLELNGFSGSKDIASGDDIFLLEKFVEHVPQEVQYLKSKQAMVTTKAQATWSLLVAQRKRWAAKTSSYGNAFSKIVAAIVLLMNFSLLAALFLAFFNVFSFKTIGYVFLVKFWIDLWLIQKTAQFLEASQHLRPYVLVSLFYPIFNVYIALSAWYGGYQWKGRTFEK